MVSLLRLGMIVAASAAVGGVSAGLRGLPWKTDVAALEIDESERSEIRATAGISLDELLMKIDEGAVVIDARAHNDFEEGHLYVHTGMIMNVPGAEVDQHLDQLMPLMGQPLVMYCNSVDCDLSEDVFLALKRLDFPTDMMHIYFPGWAGLTAAGVATVSGAEQWDPLGGEFDDEMGLADEIP